MDDERPTDYPTPQDDDISEGVVRFVGTGADSDSWAYTYLTELAEADPVRALHIIEMVLSEIAAPDQIAHVGAAQLEDVVYFSGQRLVMGDAAPFASLTTSARKYAFMRVALGHVWSHEEDPPELWAGIDEILGTTVQDRHPNLP